MITNDPRMVASSISLGAFGLMVPNIGGMTPNLLSGPTTPANAYVTEDGTTFYVAEDGTTYYVQEAWNPAPAVAAGQNRTLFFDNFTSMTVDTGLTHTGKNWYIDNQPNFIPGFTGLASNPAWFSQAGSVMKVSANNSGNVAFAEAMSIYSTNGSSYTSQVPLIPGANGFYFGIRMKAAPPASNENFQPSVALFDINGMLELFAGSSSYHYGEIDVVEMDVSNGDAFQTFHDWPSSSSQGSGATLTGVDFTQFHEWGIDVIPMSLGGGTGSLTWTVDGVQTGSALTWTAGQLGSIIESCNFMINFAASVSSAIEVDHIGIKVP